jgi:alkylation response protein AidB-like acyl-CoA dehydrogenase
MGMLIARTNPDVPKHQGITWFACDMHQEGVDIRPLREMTGRALFNEVFLSDARVRDDATIGGLHNGWAVANTTLMFERSGLGAGGHSAAAACQRRHHRRRPAQARRRLRASAGPSGGGGGGGAMAAGAVKLFMRDGQGQRHDRASPPSART